MAQTFDTSRVGGGTYELEQDASGNYKLKSVGFAQVNKLTLPDLKTSDTEGPTIGKPIIKQPGDPEVADPYKKLFKQTEGGGGGGGQDYSGVMLKTPEVKEATVRQAGDPMVKINTGKTDDPRGYLASGAAGGASLQGDKASDPFLTSGAAGGARLPSQEQGQKPGMLSTPQQQQETFAARSTGLQPVVTKVKSKASDAISKTKKVIGTVAKMLIPGANLISAIMPKETATQKHAKGYFNVRGGSVDGQRIAGNPATDLYAGMNRTSDFGNLERAGNKRIATRTNTINKRGVKDRAYAEANGLKYNPKGVSADFHKNTNNMKKQSNNYKASKQKAVQGPAGGATTDSGSGGDKGSDSGRVICTELHRTKELSTKDWIRDTKFTFKTLSIKHVKGYLLWAEPTVKHIQKYPRYRKIWKHIAQHRANDIAWRLNEGKFDLLGRIYAGIGEPVCWMLGNFISDKQISKYNLTHWRRV